MLCFQGDGLLQSIFPLWEALARQAEDQIQPDIVEACGPGICDGLDALGRTVSPAHFPQHLGIEALHAQGKSVDAGSAKVFKLLQGQGFRVGFQSDLCLGMFQQG